MLLGGEAGLRCGEMIGLEWTDVDLEKRQLCVARSEWRGHVSVPKGGRIRYVPLTKRLVTALKAGRHLRGQRVLCDEEGKPLTQKMIQVMMRRAARRANVKPGIHILRHTFCSHLAMRGAPARAIQELAGHQDLATTQRYMHLSPAALDAAIRLLDGAAENRGGIVEARERGAEPPVFIEEIGGGAGSCTRVRKHIPAGIYDAYPLLKCRSRREEAARTAGNQPQKISLPSSGTTEVSQPA